jgi:hypothetical protein
MTFGIPDVARTESEFAAETIIEGNAQYLSI